MHEHLTNILKPKVLALASLDYQSDLIILSKLFTNRANTWYFFIMKKYVITHIHSSVRACIHTSYIEGHIYLCLCELCKLRNNNINTQKWNTVVKSTYYIETYLSWSTLYYRVMRFLITEFHRIELGVQWQKRNTIIFRIIHICVYMWALFS